MSPVSPENRTERRRPSRSRSPKGMTNIKSSSDKPHQIKERDHKDASGHGRRGERDRRHRLASPDLSCSDGRRENPKRDNRDERTYTRDRSETDGTIAPRNEDHRERDISRRRDRDRRDRGLFSRVRIKEEPMSEDEEASRRRNRTSRFATMTTTTDGERQRHRQSRRSPSPEFVNSSRPVIKQERGGVDANNKQQPREKVNFGLSGKLAEDTNVYNGVVIKYNEPTEARKPGKRWRLYPFKGDEALPILPVHRQSAYLLGRERKVADIPIDHPSCSKQHAVLQYRAVQYTRDDGRIGRRIRPYIIDLDSANGTFVNNARIESKRYVELMERDVIKFGFSSREYVLLHEGSATADDDDDNGGDGDGDGNDEPQVAAPQNT